MEENNKKLIFELPDDSVDIIDTVYGILDRYNLRSKKDLIELPQKREKTQAMTIIDSAINIFNNTPQEKLSLDLQKYLEINSEIADKIILDIKKDLVPYIKISKPETSIAEKESVQSIILEKIKQGQENIQKPLNDVKKVTIKNVEENAEVSQQNKLYTDDVKKVIQETTEKGRPEKEKFGESRFEEEKKGPDSYREPIE